MNDAPAILLMIAMVGITIVAARLRGRRFVVLLQDFVDEFRGGPPPSGPLPADDSAILRRKRQRPN